MSASSLSTLTPVAFRSLIGAVSSALRPAPAPPRCDPPPCQACRRDRCDVVDCCGLLFNEALREIYRLRSGLDGCETCDHVMSPPAARACDALSPGDEARRALASPPSDRRPYAVAALGYVQAVQRESVPVIQPQAIVQRRVVTNLGTLLDVLM